MIIRSSILPSVYPVYFQDSTIINQYNVIETGFKTVDSNEEWDGQLIREYGTRWNKYEITLYINKGLFKGLEEALYAKQIEFEFTEDEFIGQTHKVRVDTDINNQSYDESLIKVNFEYIDENSRKDINYHDYVNYPTLLNNQYTTITFTNDKTYRGYYSPFFPKKRQIEFRTNLKPLDIPSESVKDTTTVDGFERKIHVDTCDKIKLRLYLNRSDAKLFSEHFNVVKNIQIAYGTATYEYKSYVDNPNPTIEEIAKDLYRVDLEIITEVTPYNNY